MIATNRTIQNRTKHSNLVSKHIIPAHHVDNSEVAQYLLSLNAHIGTKEQILYSIGIQLVAGNTNPALCDFLREYRVEIVDVPEAPSGCFDLLGSAYQYLNSKIENLERGIFYTGEATAIDFVGDLEFGNGETIIDPSCGSGSFLFRSAAAPTQIFGVDADPIAVMIAKFNYFIKFPDAGHPNIFNSDFFTWFQLNQQSRFDYVIGNPPYGANIDLTKVASFHIRSKESFSYFIEFGFRLLKEGGTFRYLLPESLLNVRKHADARIFILNQANLQRIKKYPAKFAGVMSDVYMLELNHATNKEVVFETTVSHSVPKDIYRKLQHSVFVSLNEFDIRILQRVNEISNQNLSASTFGLGVVTGNNKGKLLDEPAAGAECIYSGKEVEKYRLLPPKKWIHFDRTQLQQVAPDEIYRAPTKLVYKTINRFLKVALDDTGSLTSNSANIVIPKMDGYDPVSVMAFLNADLYSYLHFKLFGGVNKIARENLAALPFPKLTNNQRAMISSLATDVLNGANDSALQEFIHISIFGLEAKEIEYIRKTCEAK